MSKNIKIKNILKRLKSLKFKGMDIDEQILNLLGDDYVEE